MAITKTYKIEIDGKQANATLGQLDAEVKRLEESLKHVELGSLEADKLVAELGKAKAALKDIDEAVDVSFDKDRAGAYVDAINGIAGAYGVALVAAQAWGLSEKDAAKYQQRLTEVIAVVSSLEQVQKLATSEVRTALKLLANDTLGQVKNVFALGKAYIMGGESATTASKVTRGAMLATGIGALVVLVGLLISNFDTVKEYAGKIREKFKPQFDAISGFIDTAIAKLRDLGSALTFGLIDDAKTAAVAAAKEVEDALRGAAIKARARQIKELEAQGKETYDLKRRQLEDELAQMKQKTDEEKELYQDKLSEITQLDNAYYKKKDEEFKKSLDEELKAVRAGELAKLQARAALQVEGSAAQFKAQQAVREQELRVLLAAIVQDEAAITSKRTEIELARRKFLDSQALSRFEKEQAIYEATQEGLKRQVDFEQEINQKRIDKEKKVRDELDAIARGRQADALKRAKETADASAGLLALQSKAPLPIEDTLLIRVLGLTNGQVDAVKQRFAEIGSQLSGLADSLLAGSISAVDSQLSATQARLSEIDSQLQASRSAAEATEQDLAKSSGARRDFLVGKLRAERAETTQLASAKARALAEEKKQLTERARLEQQQQRLIAATSAITSAASAGKAVGIALDAVSGAAKIGFPQSLPAMLAALAAVAGAVLAAKNLGNQFADGTGSLGSNGVLRGPGHKFGGIALFSRSGHYYGEAEGGEAITPTDATAKNAAALELIRTMGRTRTLTAADFASIGNIRVMPPPATGHYTNGGQLPDAGAALRIEALEAKADTTNALLAELVGSNRTMESWGPPRFVRSYQEIADDERMLNELKAAEKEATL